MFEVSDEIVEIPTARKGSGTRIYPFATMEVGKHFDAPRDKGKRPGGTDARQANIGCAARHYAERHNPTAKFTTRLIDEHTVRCWRIA